MKKILLALTLAAGLAAPAAAIDVKTGTIGPLFGVTWTKAGPRRLLNVDLVASDANCVVAGPTTGADAVPTCRPLVAADVPATLALTVASFNLAALNTAPASAGATGTAGQIKIDADYIYICTATNTWKRVAIATWP